MRYFYEWKVLYFIWGFSLYPEIFFLEGRKFFSGGVGNFFPTKDETIKDETINNEVVYNSNELSNTTNLNSLNLQGV